MTSRPDPLRALPVVNIPAPEPAAREAARLLEQVAPDTETGDDEGIDDDTLAPDDATAPDAGEAGEATDAAGPNGERRPRRRRGRRGGRRGRGGERPPGGGTTISDTPAPDSPSTD